jgi:hypothetical protein
MCFTRVTDNDAEIVVHVDYADGSDGPLLHHEEASFPAGTTDAEVLLEMAKRGRSARLALGKQAKKPALQGQIVPIDDI